MSLLKKMVVADDIANETDSVGTGSYIWESGLYKAKVDMAYIKEADSGAVAVVLHLTNDKGQTLKSDQWIQSGKAKGLKNYYEVKGEKHYLPGFERVNSLALLALGKPLNELDTDEKTINLYDYTQKKEVPKAVEVITELLDQEIVVGVIKQIVDKSAKQDDGSYVPTGETREENEIDKFFRAEDNLTTAEILAQETVGQFITTWSERWDGQVRDKSTKDSNVSTGSFGATTGTAGTAKPKTSLFAKP